MIFTFGNYGGAQTFLRNENGGTREFLTDKNNFYTFLRKISADQVSKKPFLAKSKWLSDDVAVSATEAKVESTYGLRKLSFQKAFAYTKQHQYSQIIKFSWS